MINFRIKSIFLLIDFKLPKFVIENEETSKIYLYV